MRFQYIILMEPLPSFWGLLEDERNLDAWIVSDFACIQHHNAFVPYSHTNHSPWVGAQELTETGRMHFEISIEGRSSHCRVENQNVNDVSEIS